VILAEIIVRDRDLETSFLRDRDRDRDQKNQSRSTLTNWNNEPGIFKWICFYFRQYEIGKLSQGCWKVYREQQIAEAL